MMSSSSPDYSSCPDPYSHSDTSQQPEKTPKEPSDALPLPKGSIPRSEPDDSIMLRSNRSAARNVHIFNASDRNNSIGGLVLTNGVTNVNFYTMVEIIVIAISNFTLQNESDITIEKDDSPLQPGNYYINSLHPFTLNDETPLLRTISLGSGTRIQAFRDAVRLRDRRCVIKGEEAINAQYNIWAGFEAAHIFPLAYEQHWIESNLSRWISITPDAGGTINSVQNGLLLDSTIHQLFDMYAFSINPDDNYKIVCFLPDGKNIAGKYLDERLLSDPQRPVDQLLRWHFRQAVLVNMKGAGEPTFEHDFPPGSDMIGDILNGPKAAERMEFELFNRMATKFEDL